MLTLQHKKKKLEKKTHIRQYNHNHTMAETSTVLVGTEASETHNSLKNDNLKLSGTLLFF